MRLLDRYLLRELLVPLGYCLGGFLVFWITYDLFTEINHFQQNHVLALDVFRYYCVKAPEILVTILPIALLLALLYALTNHARHHELTAMRAAGVTLWRLSAPYFAVAVIASAALFLLNEFVVPNGAERAEQIITRRSATPAGDPRLQKGVTFRNDRDQRTWYIGLYNQATAELQKLQIEWIQENGSRHQFNAERGVWTNNMWVFHEAQEFTLPSDRNLQPATQRWATRPMPELTETPRLILSEIKVSQLDSIKTARKAQLGVRQIADYLELHPQLDARRRELLRTTFHSRFAAPWTCVVVVLISLPFGAASGRRNVFVGVASSVFICFAYYVLSELSLAFGGRASVPPWVAAWIPNLVFGLAGIVMTQRTR